MSDGDYFDDVWRVAIEKNERKSAELILSETIFVQGPTLRSFNDDFDRSLKVLKERIGSTRAAISIPRYGRLGFGESVGMNLERSTRHHAEGREGALWLPSTEWPSRRRNPIRLRGA